MPKQNGKDDPTIMMKSKYEPLFQPYTIGSHTFKNRILGGPLGCNEGNPGAEITYANIDYYGALARGGAARVVGGGDAVINRDAGYMGGQGRVKFFLDPPSGDFIGSIRHYVHTIHRYNCLAFVQFTCDGGPSGLEPIAGLKNLGPSAKKYPNGSEVIEMTRDDIERIANDYVRCVKLAKECGLDGCLIHAGHGKLLDQFRASDCNFRTDEYGGSLEGRCHFPLMVMRRIREAVGPDFILEYRTSVDEHTPGGITIDETIEFFKLMEKEHLVDLFHVTSGRHTDAKSNAYCISPATFPAAPNRAYCRKIKAAGIKTPLVIINSCADPDIAAEIVANGEAEFVCMSRQINLADPYYPRKLHEGREELIDNCLRCHGCYDVVGPCSVNPTATYKIYEASYPLKKAPGPRKVCVVGGGIAGLKAAHTAAERGHQVVLFEREDHLGGQLIFSDTDTIKTDIKRYKDNMIRRVMEHPNIDVRLGVAADTGTVEAELPYAVIAAVGAEPKRPAIGGVDRENVLTVLDAYCHPERLQGRVVMLGSGLTACEVALHLNNTGYPVTIVGRRERLCYHERFDVMPTALYDPVPTFQEWFEQRGIDVYYNSDGVEVVDGAVKIRDVVTGEERMIPADTVVLAAGMTPRKEEAYKFRNSAPFFAMAGDCIAPKKIRDAVFTGYWNAMEI